MSGELRAKDSVHDNIHLNATQGRKQQDREYIVVLILAQVDCDFISEQKAAPDKRSQRKCPMSA